MVYYIHVITMILYVFKTRIIKHIKDPFTNLKSMQSILKNTRTFLVCTSGINDT